MRCACVSCWTPACCSWACERCRCACSQRRRQPAAEKQRAGKPKQNSRLLTDSPPGGCVTANGLPSLTEQVGGHRLAPRLTDRQTDRHACPLVPSPWPGRGLSHPARADVSHLTDAHCDRLACDHGLSSHGGGGGGGRPGTGSSRPSTAPWHRAPSPRSASAPACPRGQAAPPRADWRGRRQGPPFAAPSTGASLACATVVCHAASRPAPTPAAAHSDHGEQEGRR